MYTVCTDYLIIFWDLLWFFFATFFQKQASKDHLTQSFLKTMLLNEKQSKHEREMYGNISLYSQYFSTKIESNVHKTYFYFLKLSKKYFFSIFLDQINSTWNKKYIHVMQQIISKSPKTFISDNCILYIRNIFAAITLWSLFTNLNDNEICAKKFDQVFKKINTFSFVDKNEHLWYDW